MLEYDDYQIRIDHFRLSEYWAKRAREWDSRLWAGTAVKVCESVTAIRAAGRVISPCGGLTVAQIYDGEKLIAEGTALCSPDDNFNKKIGRAIATGRALKELRKTGQ